MLSTDGGGCYVRSMDPQNTGWASWAMPYTFDVCGVETTIRDSITPAVSTNENQALWRLVRWQNYGADTNLFYTDRIQTGRDPIGYPVTVSFAKPMQEVRILLARIMWPGMTVTAYDGAGAVLATWVAPDPADPAPYNSPDGIEVSHTLQAHGIRSVVVRPGLKSDGTGEIFDVELVVVEEDCVTGDPMLDDRAVRRGLDSAFQASSPTAPYGQRHERAGVMAQYDADGHREVLDQTPPGTTDCSVPPRAISTPPGGRLTALWHTHPYDPGPATDGSQAEWVTQCGATVFPKPLQYLPQPGGLDWSTLDRLNDQRAAAGYPRIPEYVYDRRNIYRMNPNTPSAPHANNFTTFIHEQATCRWL